MASASLFQNKVFGLGSFSTAEKKKILSDLKEHGATVAYGISKKVASYTWSLQIAQ